MKNITLNFGVIRDTVSRLATMEILKENKSNSLKTFTDAVKKNPVLLKQHYVFKNFEDTKPFVKERLAERFIAQNISVLRGIKWKDVVEENKKIRLSLLETSHIESNNGKNDELFNSIHTLIESATNPNFIKIEEGQRAYEHILQHLTREVVIQESSQEKTDNPPLNNWKFITKLAVNNFNQRYAHLNENEKKVLNMLLADDKKKSHYVQDLKKENLKLIKKLLETANTTERVEILEGFQNKLNKDITYDSFTADDIIISYSELNENLKSM